MRCSIVNNSKPAEYRWATWLGKWKEPILDVLWICLETESLIIGIDLKSMRTLTPANWFTFCPIHKTLCKMFCGNNIIGGFLLTTSV